MAGMDIPPSKRSKILESARRFFLGRKDNFQVVRCIGMNLNNLRGHVWYQILLLEE
jgi:hypothetical protein